MAFEKSLARSRAFLEAPTRRVREGVHAPFRCDQFTEYGKFHASKENKNPSRMDAVYSSPNSCSARVDIHDINVFVHLAVFGMTVAFFVVSFFLGIDFVRDVIVGSMEPAAFVQKNTQGAIDWFFGIAILIFLAFLLGWYESMTQEKSEPIGFKT